jgi:alpha-amylase/alpha-mannosidase (GH57 family)
VTGRYVCIHGHFYQPPREDPWSGGIEAQPSAAPFRDWNERLTAECYRPNAASRIMGAEGQVARVVNNYGAISFDFGPTLLQWLEANAGDVYRAVLAADRSSAERYGGHGSALAQCYNHMIMPLASRRDKRTQVVWGIKDFEHRFQRRPEGMWLPETAADLETLEIMAAQGIRFTLLAPRQALREREMAGEWEDAGADRIDTRQAYSLGLASGRRIAAFFYDGDIAHAVAFGGLLESGDGLAGRLLAAFSAGSDRPQLVHIATDGESYGHHHRFGEMALAYALDQIQGSDGVALTNYGQFLERHPPGRDVQLREGSSWSCIHGVERWRADCGCSTGEHPGWSQGWRAPLREALDRLRDGVEPEFEQHAGRLLSDPWAARDDYIDVLLDGSAGGVERYLRKHAKRGLAEDERARVTQLMDLQRNAMLMYTSCGWFFDEISGIEAVQVLRYGGRVIQLARELFGMEMETGFLAGLEPAASNVPEFGNGRAVYERLVRPLMGASPA